MKDFSQSVNNVITYVIGASLVGLFVFVVRMNSTFGTQSEFNKNQALFNERVLKQFESMNLSLERLDTKIESGTSDRFTRREAELNFDLLKEQSAKNNAEIKLWMYEQNRIPQLPESQ
ncbi:MAG: hypothetical protein AAFW89_12940 [Bacteroidota bacterium]